MAWCGMGESGTGAGRGPLAGQPWPDSGSAGSWCEGWAPPTPPPPRLPTAEGPHAGHDKPEFPGRWASSLARPTFNTELVVQSGGQVAREGVAEEKHAAVLQATAEPVAGHIPCSCGQRLPGQLKFHVGTRKTSKILPARRAAGVPALLPTPPCVQHKGGVGDGQGPKPEHRRMGDLDQPWISFIHIFATQILPHCGRTGPVAPRAAPRGNSRQ